MGTSPHPRAGYGMKRRSPVKAMTVRRLVDAAIDSRHSPLTDNQWRIALHELFRKILYPNATF